MDGSNSKQQQIPGLPVCYPQVMNKGGEDMEGVEGTPGEASVGATQEAMATKDQEKAQDYASALESDTSTDSSTDSSSDDDDGSFLDLLVDTLDGEFDPDLLL